MNSQMKRYIGGGLGAPILSIGVSVPMDMGCISCLVGKMCSPNWKLSKSCNFGIFIEASSRRHELIINTTASSSPLSKELGVELKILSL